MPALLEQPAVGQSQQNCVPMAGEDQGAFFDRAWRALKKQVPKPNRRSVEIIRLWKESQNDADLRQEAQERFPPDKFTHSGPRCIFLSHTIPPIAEEIDPQTQEVLQEAREGTQYNRQNIQHLVDYANFRIRNSGQFAALSDGHMPTLDEKATGRPDADTLGWAGPFYLGLFGNEEPRWAIFCDEWIYNDDIPRAEKLQRRSPEVFWKEPIERRTMDPIAMLGSETPRLDSGMNLYSRRADGHDVLRYSAMSMALPNANNSYVPGGEKKPLKYGATEMAGDLQNGPQNDPNDPGADQNSDQNPNQDQGGGPDEQVINAVVEAITALMPSILQKVKDTMNQGNKNDPEAVPQDDTDPNVQAEEVPRGIDAPPADSPMPGADQNPMPQAQAPASPPPPQAAPPSASASQPQQPIDDKHAEYSAMSPQCGMAYAAGHQAGCSKGRPMTYSKDPQTAGALEARIVALEKQNAAKDKRIADLENAARDSERYAKIHAIAATHEIGSPEEVLQEVIDVTDAEFDRYCKVLTKAAPKAETAPPDLYDDPNFDVEAERYGKRSGAATARVTKADVDRYSHQATQVVLQKRRRGVETTFDEELKTIFEAHGLPDPNL